MAQPAAPGALPAGCDLGSPLFPTFINTSSCPAGPEPRDCWLWSDTLAHAASAAAGGGGERGRRWPAPHLCEIGRHARLAAAHCFLHGSLRRAGAQLCAHHAAQLAQWRRNTPQAAACARRVGIRQPGAGSFGEEREQRSRRQHGQRDTPQAGQRLIKLEVCGGVATTGG